jgi:hypothetical protein
MQIAAAHILFTISGTLLVHGVARQAELFVLCNCFNPSGTRWDKVVSKKVAETAALYVHAEQRKIFGLEIEESQRIS